MTMMMMHGGAMPTNPTCDYVDDGDGACTRNDDVDDGGDGDTMTMRVLSLIHI